MTTLSPINAPGQADGGGNLDALFLKKFSGEVARFYKAELKLAGSIRSRTITGGKSYTFGATGEATAGYHIRGTRGIDLLTNIEFSERIVYIDRPIVNFQFIDDWEEAVNHFEVRGPIAEAMGQAIGVLQEKQAMRTVFRGSLVATDVAGQPLGLQTVEANAGTSAAAFLSTLEAQVLHWNKNNVPMMGRMCFVIPEVWNLLVDLTDFQSLDLGNGGNGSLKSNDVGMLKGVKIIMTSVMPSDDYTQVAAYTAGILNNYVADMQNAVALFCTPRAIGQVTLKGMEVVTQHEPLDSGVYLKAGKACGFGVLRESDCGSVVTA